MRNYNFGATPNVINYSAPATPFTDSGARPARLFADNVMPHHHSHINDWLGNYSTFTTESFISLTIITFPAQTQTSCQLCGKSGLVDIRTLANYRSFSGRHALLTGAITDRMTVGFQEPLEFPIQLVIPPTRNVNVTAFAKVRYEIPANTIDPVLGDFQNDPFMPLDFELDFNGAIPALEVVQTVALTFRFLVPPDQASARDYYADSSFLRTFTNDEPAYSARQSVAGGSEIELPPRTGFSIERYGGASPLPSSDANVRINIGSPLSIPAPSALYRQPVSPNEWEFMGGADWNGPNINPGVGATPREAGQLFLDRRIVTDSNNDPAEIDFEEARIELDSNVAGRNVALHVPSPAVTVGGDVLPAGSMIYPETGQAIVAQTFPEFLTLTLEMNGAVAHIAGGGGAGRPSVYRVYDTFSASSPDVTITVPMSVTNRNTPFNQSSTDEIDVDVVFEHVVIKVEISDVAANEFLELDTRAMDAVLRDPTYLREATGAIRIVNNNYATDPRFEFAPANHRISLLADAEIPVFRYTEDPPDGRSVTMPVSTTIFAHIPSRPLTTGVVANQTNDSTLLREADIGGLVVDRTLPSMVKASVGFAFPLGASPTVTVMVPNNITAHTNPVVLDGEFQFLDQRRSGVNSGFNDDMRAVTSDIYQNLWLRINDPIDVTLSDASVISLPKDTVVNPLIGTYLLPVIEGAPPPVERVRINAPSELTPTTDFVVAGPALTLPRGMTLAVGSQPARFEGVRAIIGHSPGPLDSVTCASDGTAITVNQLTERDGSPGSTETIPQVTFTNALARFGVDAGGVDPDSPQFGDANKCMLLDLPENTDLDEWFVIGSFDGGSANDHMRMVGGRLSQ